MAVNKIILERDGLIVGDTQLVASGGGVTVGQNLAIAGNSYVQNSFTVNGNTSITNAYMSGNVGIGITTPLAKLHISAPGGGNPNFIMSGDGEQTFRFYNTAIYGSTRTSWKLASRLNTDWEWIWYTDSTGVGINDLTLANLRGTVLNIDANRNVAISANLTVSGRVNSGFTNAAATSGTITINSDLYNQYQVVVNGTAAFAAPTGTPQDGQRLTIRIKDSGTRQTISFTTGANAFRGVGLSLPTVSTAAVLYLGCVWNAHDSRWDAIALASA